MVAAIHQRLSIMRLPRKHPAHVLFRLQGGHYRALGLPLGNTRIAQKLAGKSATQPSLSQPEVVPDGMYRLIQCLGRLLCRHATEITHLDQLSEVRIFRG